MGKYTEFLENKAENIYSENNYDGDYIDELKKVIESFRSFDMALDTFIVEHGYLGDIKDISLKTQFITDKLNEAEVPIPRNIKKWFSNNNFSIPKKKTAFQLCFAFHLKLDEANDFLSKTFLFRGFDYHSMEDIVCYYCLKNSLSYTHVLSILNNVSIVKANKKNIGNVVYTRVIENEINEIQSESELIQYLSENVERFEYNSVTACDLIRNLWKSIVEKNEGLAIREKNELYISFDNDDDNYDNDDENKRKERKRIDNSVWEIYLQILGLSGNNSSKYYKDRSIKPILKDNKLLHPLAEDSFPDRDGINKILKGEHVSENRIRKLLVLLIFYKYWVSKALSNHSYFLETIDAKRCILTINNYLFDAGYQLLYAGNPYDFIMIFASNTDHPLLTFREYMQEMFYIKNDEIESQYINEC